MTPTRVVIADPLTMFRSGVRDVLDREKDFPTVEASSLRELVEVVTRTCPDIALIDLDLPPRGGIAAVGRLAEFSSLHAIPWSFAPDGDTVLSAIRSGASGYLDKDLSPAGLVRSLRGVRTGEAPLPRALVTRLIEGLHGAPGTRTRPGASGAAVDPRSRGTRARYARCTQQGDRRGALHSFIAGSLEALTLGSNGRERASSSRRARAILSRSSAPSRAVIATRQSAL